MDTFFLISITMRNSRQIWDGAGFCYSALDAKKAAYLQCGVFDDGGSFNFYNSGSNAREMGRAKIFPSRYLRLTKQGEAYEDVKSNYILSKSNPEHEEFLVFENKVNPCSPISSFK
jgi:hypothetical protein